VSPVPGAVRRAGAGDVERILPLWRALLDVHAAIDPAFALAGDAELRVPLARLLADPAAAAWVFECDGVLDGWCAARIEPAPAALAEPARASITELGVREPARRRGIGRALVGSALGWAAGRGARRIEVRVAARNGAGQAFWRALGFADFVDVLDLRL
jgi:ribosomal protein S18 acetylase RimI-like enzyme